ncbi:MAG: hypothetical protein DMG00_24970, partial [Acidobacteria bacterium]
DRVDAPSTASIFGAWHGRPPERFSATWTGTFVVLGTSTYAFATDSDDGSWLYVARRARRVARHLARAVPVIRSRGGAPLLPAPPTLLPPSLVSVSQRRTKRGRRAGFAICCQLSPRPPSLRQSRGSEEGTTRIQLPAVLRRTVRVALVRQGACVLCARTHSADQACVGSVQIVVGISRRPDSRLRAMVGVVGRLPSRSPSGSRAFAS